MKHPFERHPVHYDSFPGLDDCIELDDGHMLNCPECGVICNLHHGAVRIMERTRGEDGPGVCYTVDGLSLNMVPAEDLPRRRNTIDIAFWCELGHGRRSVLNCYR